MHRTTISLDEAVYRRVMQLAKRRGRSMARTIEDVLRGALFAARSEVRPELPLHVGNGPLPGVDVADRDRLYDVLES